MMVRDVITGTWVERLSRLVVAGVVLTATEVLVAVGLGHRYFLSSTEIARYALLAWANLSLWVLSVGSVLSLAGDLVAAAPTAAGRTHRLRACVFVALAPALAWLFWSLTAGRRVRDVPGRAAIVVVAALALSLVALWTFSRFRTMRRLPAVFVTASVIAMLLNATVLRRLYPSFHFALSTGSIGTLAVAALLIARDKEWHWRTRVAGAVGVVLAMVSALALPWISDSLARAPNGRFAVSQTAPITGQWLDWWLSSSEVASEMAVAPHAKPLSVAGDHGAAAGIDLQGQDILIITVDALRADRLRAYGGNGLTPAMDRLAETSVVFKRAYTPTPHTSYALSSMLTGKFMHPVLELPNAPTDHRTLPEMLRRYGYRTAAFFPPAVFFVDGERFAALKRNDFGFEYRKVQYASARERVKQLDHYLSRAEAGHPVLAWVHLFEPHEPYTPDAAFARGNSAVDRYDGEVAQADDGVGGLVEAFRSRRPNSTVIVSADHGEEFDDHGGRFHGTTLFDEQIRVPLIWSSPGLSPRIIDAPVETIDLATTLMAALGVPRDARMRGDNLAVMLASDDESAGPAVAFADVGESTMATDGSHKLICDAGGGSCVLFDLVDDPRETRDVALQFPKVVATLRRAMSDLAASIPAVEAVALADGVGWPQALARGRLGDRTVGPDLVPLLGSTHAAYRAGAARACGELRYAAALQVVDQLRVTDPDPLVRAESALAALVLGEATAAADVVALAVGHEHGRDLGVRAALILAERKNAAGVTTLIETARDDTVDERQRSDAVTAIGELRAAVGGAVLIELLADVRLRPLAAAALGKLGGPVARKELRRALAAERYPGARQAEVDALIALKDPTVRAQIERFLGTDTSLPAGVLSLLRLGALTPPSARGARLIDASSWRGDAFVCDTEACWPKRDAVAPDELAPAVLQLPVGALRKAARITFAIVVTMPEARVRIGESTFDVAPGPQQVSAALSASATERTLTVASSEGVKWLALSIVPQAEDVAPPAPEPVVVSPE